MRTLRWTLLLLATACAEEAADDTLTDTDDPTAGAFVDGKTWVPAAYADPEPTRVIFLGDSITAGQGAGSRSRSYVSLLVENDAGAWPEEDGEDLASRFSDLEVVDVSQGGATTTSMRRDQLRDLADELAFPVRGQTLVFFTIAGNDMQGALLPGANVAQIRDTALDNMGRIIDWLQDPTRFEDGVQIYATNV